MGKKYMDTKDGTLESSILGVWQEAAKKQEKLDPVGKEDGDIDNDGDQDASDKYLAKRRKTIAKAIKKDEEVKEHKGDKPHKHPHEEEEVEESYEIGTDEYRKHTEDVTPGEDGEWAAARDFKVSSMKEALAKVWGLDEKKLDKTEEDDKIAPVKGKKTMTGGDVAEVEVDPEKKEK